MRLLLIFVGLLYCVPAFPCTTFILESGSRIYFGRNLDWDWEDGIVVVNPRNLNKRAFVSSTNAAAWTSKYGSVTFNQFGRELPFGGMNEAGLVVENMWLDDTEYPSTDARPEINMLQWIQYQLDNFSSVQEVLASDKKLRLEKSPTKARIHYLVCDAKGQAATIEFLDGTTRVHSGPDLQAHALANDTYERSVAALSANPSFGDLSKPLPNKDSIRRFCRAAARAKAFQGGKQPADDVAYAFETLEQVRQDKYTVWQMVYDISNRQIHFRTLSNTQNRRVDLKDLNFDCNRPIQSVDIKAKAPASGVIVFDKLDETEHQNYLKTFYSQDSVKKAVGDLTPMIDPLLFVIRNYKCAE